jgi:hypothetical protein
MAAVVTRDESVVPAAIATLYARGLGEVSVPAKRKEQPVRLKLPDKSGSVEFLDFFEWPVQQPNTAEIERFGSGLWARPPGY